MTWEIDWAVLGQIVTCVVIAAVAVGLWIGWLFSRRPSLPRDPMKYEGRDLTEEQRRHLKKYWPDSNYEVGRARDVTPPDRSIDALNFDDDDTRPAA